MSGYCATGKHKLIGKQSPDFILADTHGDSIHLSEFRENPYVLIFFGSWSEQAKKYLAEVSKLRKTYGGQGLLIFGVTAETDTAMVNAFARENRIDYPLLTGGSDVLQQYEVGGVPDTYCVTKYGMVCERLVGYSPEMEATLETVVKLMVMKCEDKPPARGN